ncbi:MAG: LD-carboxypeptidase [Bacteroidales bacterium]|nr:LD-carboxypeptidase [Bacteroidales bacterium]
MKKILVLISLMISSAVLAQPMPRLSVGDTIAIAAPSGKVEEGQVLPAVQYLQSQGFNVVVPEEIWLEDNGFAGTTSQRAALFQQLLDRPGIKAILCARGGYGAVSIIDSLDFSIFRRYPKWICGFSDITVFHSHLHVLGFPTLHSVMPVTIKEKSFDNEYNASMVGALRGEPLCYEFASSPYNRQGTVTAPVVGGNLSILYSLLESASSIDTEGKILFIEDTDENIYHLHRMLMALDRAGKLSQLKALVVGCMSRIKIDDYFNGSSLESVILEICGKYDYPVCFDFPAGHCGQNFALRLGCPATLKITPEQCSLEFE